MDEGSSGAQDLLFLRIFLAAPLPTGLLQESSLLLDLPSAGLMHHLHTLVSNVTPRAAWTRAITSVSRTVLARSYLPLQQSHLLREEVDNQLLAKGCREQVAEGGSHRREH